MKHKPIHNDSGVNKTSNFVITQFENIIDMFDNSTIGLFFCNLDGKFINVNDQFSKLTEYSKKELYTMTSKEITHPDDMDADHKLMCQLMEKKRKNYQIEKRYITKNKIIIWISLLNSIMPDAESNSDIIIGIVEDISEKKRILDEFETNKSNYKSTLKLMHSIPDSIPDFIGILDLNQNIILYNQAGYKYLNKTYEEIVGKKCRIIIGKKKVCDLCCFEKAIETKSPSKCEQYIPEQNAWLDFRAYPIFDKNNEIIFVIEHIRDISDVKKLELQLKVTIKDLQEAKLKAEESDSLKTAFLHNISHEIKTPLNGIIGFSDLLQKTEKINPQKIREYADIIIRSGWRLSNIINNLVSVATIESGQEKVNITKVDIQTLIQSAISNFQIKARGKAISLYFKPEIPNLNFISTDETKLFEILSNLINNAIKFTNAGYVEVGVQALNDKLHFYIKDTGIGIKNDDHEKIFKRFAQSDSNIDSLFDGSGLGLSICKAYIELLGGRIWLESELGKGSTFYFNIPLILENDTNVNQTIENIQGVKTTILIAEDDEFNYLYFTEIVQELDIKILHAKNGLEAVEFCIKEQRIDLIFMDLKMPVMNGHEATKRIKAIRPNIPIIALSAYFEDKEKEISQKMGCLDYITKPYVKEDIIDRIRKIHTR